MQFHYALLGLIAGIMIAASGHAQETEALPETLDEQTESISPALPADEARPSSAETDSGNRFGISLMFSDVDNRNIDQVIVALNRGQEPARQTANQDVDGPSEEDILAEILRQAQQEEQEDVQLPDFFLSSIVYRNADDWSVWLRPYNVTPPSPAQDPTDPNFDPNMPPPEPIQVPSRLTLTSDNPSDELTSVSIDSIDESSVVLAWKPPNSFSAFNRFKNKEAELEKNEKIKNRLVLSREVTFDADKGIFYARLSPNQTVSLDLMQIVEGRFRTPNRMNAMDMNSAGGEIVGNTRSRNNAISSERRLSEELLGNIRQLQRFIPQRNQ